jgi:hypothetical protein
MVVEKRDANEGHALHIGSHIRAGLDRLCDFPRSSSLDVPLCPYPRQERQQRCMSVENCEECLPVL